MKRTSSPLSLLVVLLSSVVAFACNVPVFRYALERWPADLYEVVVLHDGELSPAAAVRLETLRESGTASSQPANLNVRTIEASEMKDELLKHLWDKHNSSEPLMAVLYPRNAREIPDRVVGTLPLTDESITQLVDSPVRQAVTQKLLDGDSAVWIFVPCGDADQDEVAKKTLQAEIKRNQDELELPPQDEIESDEFFREETPIELRLSFSMVTLDRSDPREKCMLQMLLGSEPDLESLDQPMAFPVIGRGRVLYALVGKGIFRDTIAMASRFVVGPCSCQVKDQNPGFDLLLAVDWDEKLGGSVISKPPIERSGKPTLLTIPPGK